MNGLYLFELERVSGSKSGSTFTQRALGSREVKAGDWLVDAVDQWHEGVVLGEEPVRLLTIDQAPPGAAVTAPRNP